MRFEHSSRSFIDGRHASAVCLTHTHTMVYPLQTGEPSRPKPEKKQCGIEPKLWRWCHRCFRAPRPQGIQCQFSHNLRHRFELPRRMKMEILTQFIDVNRLCFYELQSNVDWDFSSRIFVYPILYDSPQCEIADWINCKYANITVSSVSYEQLKEIRATTLKTGSIPKKYAAIGCQCLLRIYPSIQQFCRVIYICTEVHIWLVACGSQVRKWRESMFSINADSLTDIALIH